MKKRDNEGTLILTVLVIYIIIVIILFVYITKKAQAMPETAAETPSLKGPKVEYKAEGLRDPFQSPIKEEEVKVELPKKPVKPLPPLTVQGIIWGGSLSQAIINDKVVKKGDTVSVKIGGTTGEIRIIDISKDGITVSFEEQVYNLSSPAGVSLESPKKSPEGGAYEK